MGARTDGRQDQSYIQVRPTFHQSKTIHSVFMQKFEVECTSQKPSLASGTLTDQAAGKAQSQVDAELWTRPRGAGVRVGTATARVSPPRGVRYLCFVR